jgi:23S rRNA pseudouridine1911/1915/1917 synthase
MKINYKIDKSINVRDYLLSFYMSKTRIYKLFLDKCVSKNGNIINEREILKPNDILTIDYKEKRDYSPEQLNLDILYEDDYFLIINKPKHILIHDSKSNTDSLSNRVANYYYNNGISLNVRFAHRLDFETTGLIIYCKDMLTHSYMNHFIETHDIRREYRLLASGKMNKKNGFIDLPIGKHRHENGKMIVSKTGKEAKTYYEVLKEYKNYSYIKCLLETGRTHQIRVHFSCLGHPLLGDLLYGGDTKLINRVSLHSYMTSFIHPVYKNSLEVKCELPLDMKGLV